MDFFDRQPIVACSSGLAHKTAIALIRLSGFEDFCQLSQFFSVTPKPRRVAFCELLDENGKIIDKIVLTYFKAPIPIREKTF